MARLPYLDKSDLLPEHQDLLARNHNLYRVLAHSPRAARSLNTLARYIRDGSRLDPRLRELAILQVGYLTGAAWEMTLDLTVSDETFAVLQQELDNERLTDLVVTISFYNGLVRLLETMQVDVEEDHLPYLEEFPLPKR